MPIIEVNNTDWENDPEKVNTFLASLDRCIERLSSEVRKARAQGMRDFVAKRRAYSHKQNWWLEDMKFRMGVTDSDVANDFWDGIFTDIT